MCHMLTSSLFLHFRLKKGVNIIIGETGNDRVCGGSGNDILAGITAQTKLGEMVTICFSMVMILLLPHYFPMEAEM